MIRVLLDEGFSAFWFHTKTQELKIHNEFQRVFTKRRVLQGRNCSMDLF
jgi:hypothetical protein